MLRTVSTVLDHDSDHPNEDSRRSSALERKLGHHLDFTRAEREALDRLLARDIRTLRGRGDLIEAGAKPREINVIIEGWACRYTKLEGGRRQIVAFYLPGDVCDFDVFVMSHIDQAIAAIDGARVAGIDRAALSDLSKNHPRVSHALWWESLTAAAVQRAWLINVGQRNALQRVAHLLSELIRRLEAVGLFRDGRCEIPLTQADIADACAMTPVHTNRTIQALRRTGAIDFRDEKLIALDLEAMHRISGFDPSYLQFGDLPAGSVELEVSPAPNAYAGRHK